MIIILKDLWDRFSLVTKSQFLDANRMPSFLHTFSPQIVVFFSFCRYFGPVNFNKGWCPGSKAANFSQLGSYANVPNINITNCDFTVAFWIKSSGFEGPIMAIWSISGKLFYVTLKRSIVLTSLFNTFGEPRFKNSDWNHIIITCEQFKIRLFVNGTEKELKEQWNQNLFLSSNSYQPYYIIANNPDLFTLPLVTKPFIGSVMDLYVVRGVLSLNQISDLFKGNKHISYFVVRIVGKIIKVRRF